MPPKKAEEKEGESQPAEAPVKLIPTKICAACEKENKIGKKACDCGYVFKKKKKPSLYQKTTTVRGRPLKACPECNAPCPVATATCKSCSHAFRPTKPKEVRTPAVYSGAKRGRKPKRDPPVKKQKKEKTETEKKQTAETEKAEKTKEKTEAEDSEAEKTETEKN
eukprot:g22934.t1